MQGAAVQRAAVIAVPNGTISTDGRIARGERTRRKVAEALIALLEEGEAQPTAKAVAQRAGVSLRLVFHHFDDMDALYRAVMVLQAQRYWSKLRDISPDLPLAHRIDRSVRQRSRLFDAVGPVRRVAVPMGSHSTDIAEALAESNDFLRTRLTVTFRPELDTAMSEGGDLLEAIDVAASWETWERLRRGQNLSSVAARRIMARTMTALLSCPEPAAAAQTVGATTGPDPEVRRVSPWGLPRLV